MHAPKKSRAPNLRIPSDWQPRVKSAILNIVSLARVAMAYTRSWSHNSPAQRVRLKSQLDERDQLIAWLMEELSIKDARWERLPTFGSVDRWPNRPNLDVRNRLRRECERLVTTVVSASLPLSVARCIRGRQSAT